MTRQDKAMRETAAMRGGAVEAENNLETSLDRVEKEVEIVITSHDEQVAAL
jgi:antitoxin (DNA-binding transcriptional repressor) of toxin-antitoxin stability system